MASGCGGEFDHHLVWKEGEGIHGVSGGGRRVMRPLPFAFPTVKFSWLPESMRGVSGGLKLVRFAFDEPLDHAADRFQGGRGDPIQGVRGGVPGG